MQDEERLWTELIDKYKDSDAPWKADVVGRAYGKGIAKSRHQKSGLNCYPWELKPPLCRESRKCQITAGKLGLRSG